MLSENRKKFEKVSEKFGEFFSKTGISPNTFTSISLLFALFSFIFLIKRNLILTALFFLFAALLDLIDGAVAKFANRATKKGAYLDTILDRYVEAIILLGFLFLPLPKIYLDAKLWIFLSLFGSLMTTYAKAAGKEKDILKEELKKGLLERPERLFLIFLSLILGIFNFSWMIYPIIFLAILSNFTAVQRIYAIIFQAG
jgi:phosphatidylglycerophosphate synthase